MADIAALTTLIEPEAHALGLTLVRVKMLGGGDDQTLQVMAERPDTRQLTLDDCAALSRAISEKFDELDPIEAAYRLEVSSPGIDRPLTRRADFADWAGHETRILFAEPQDGRKTVTGLLRGIEGDTITIEAGQHGATQVLFANIGSAKLVMTDALIAATAPLSTAGADEFIEEVPAGRTDLPEAEGQN